LEVAFPLESNRLSVIIEQGAQGLLIPKARVIHDIARTRRLTPKDRTWRPAVTPSSGN
jgi:hypothetical protein